MKSGVVVLSDDEIKSMVEVCRFASKSHLFLLYDVDGAQVVFGLAHATSPWTLRTSRYGALAAALDSWRNSGHKRLFGNCEVCRHKFRCLTNTPAYFEVFHGTTLTLRQMSFDAQKKQWNKLLRRPFYLPSNIANGAYGIMGYENKNIR